MSPTPSPRPTAPPAARLHLPEVTRSRLRSLASDRFPHEACGVLVGTRSFAGARVVEVTASRNLESDRPGDRFTLDPVHLLTVETDARLRGLEVLGVWHSHPDRPAVPSETDRAGAWEGWSYVIVSVPGGAARTIRSWRLAAGRFAEESIEPAD